MDSTQFFLFVFGVLRSFQRQLNEQIKHEIHGHLIRANGFFSVFDFVSLIGIGKTQL